MLIICWGPSLSRVYFICGILLEIRRIKIGVGIYFRWVWSPSLKYHCASVTWNAFQQAFENYTKVEDGYTSIGNVRNIQHTRQQDMTESFWFAETLKYLYLLFDDTRQLIDLDRWVFNSEGHPLPIYES